VTVVIGGKGKRKDKKKKQVIEPVKEEIKDPEAVNVSI